MTDRTRIAIYGRVSTDEQQRKETIDAQLEALRRTLPGDYEVVETYLDDGISGTVSFEDRPAGRRLLKEAEAGRFEQVLAYKLDRLGPKPGCETPCSRSERRKETSRERRNAMPRLRATGSGR